MDSIFKFSFSRNTKCDNLVTFPKTSHICIWHNECCIHVCYRQAVALKRPSWWLLFIDVLVCYQLVQWNTYNICMVYYAIMYLYRIQKNRNICTYTCDTSYMYNKLIVIRFILLDSTVYNINNGRSNTGRWVMKYKFSFI